MKTFFNKLTLACAFILPLTAYSYVGGKAAPKGSLLTSVAFPQLSCTGVKVAPKRFITAAHCLANRGPFLILKRSDTIEILARNSEGKLFLEQIRIHRVEVNSTYMNKISEVMDPDLTVVAPGIIDIAIIDLEDETNIPETPLAETPFKKNDAITVGGFGCEDRYEDGSGDTITRFLKHTVVYNVAAKKVATVGKFTGSSTVLDLNGKTKSSGCGGDSGGPVYSLASGKLSVVGINSYIDEKDNLHFVKISDKNILRWVNSIKDF